MVQKPVLVLGSTCVDVIIRVDHLPKTEENLHPQSQRFAMGGCAYNVANVLGRFGADVTFVTPVGLKGVYGPYVLEKLKELPFVSPVALPKEENGCCYCLVEKSGERTFLSIHGAEYTFDPAWMQATEEKEFAYTYVCGLEVEECTGEKLVSWLETARVGKVFYAPGPRGMKVEPRLTQRLFELNPILHINEREALLLSGKNDLETAIYALNARTKAPVIVTLGAEGAAYLEDERVAYVPAVPVTHVKDTIGAGDAHAGAVLTALSRGQAMGDAVAFANRVSSCVVEVEGATLPEAVLTQMMTEQ